MKHILLLLLLSCVYCRVTFTHELIGDSFHKILRLSIADVTDTTTIEYTLPVGVFLDPHDPQLSGISSNPLVSLTVTPEDINIELPDCGDDLEAMVLVLTIIPDPSTDNRVIDIPLHVRYHCVLPGEPHAGLHHYTIAPPRCWALERDGTPAMCSPPHNQLMYPVPVYSDQGTVGVVTVWSVAVLAGLVLIAGWRWA